MKVIPSGGYLVAGSGGPGAPAKPMDVQGGIKSNMQGTILKIKVKKGDKVKVKILRKTFLSGSKEMVFEATLQ